ncbi:DUF349 domain-containing protein [Oxalobacter formigenes]|uniref:DUF349 domain-containing protein n=1 Tax=Oxalobacter formigenes TaxID=847 RepID=UPI00241DBA7F|nr:DUF349 domain-containing protein [Oxalobacter formigenes]
MLNFLLNCFRKKRQKAIPQPAVRKEPSESQLAKKEALQQAEQLSGDDLLIADFVLQCKFADARFIAARKIQSRDALEKVRAAVVKTDRRVYRLVQTRLNELAFSDKFFADVGTCIEKAAHLVQEPGLTPNLVAELDREWKMITSVDNGLLSSELLAQFNSLHSQLTSRLALQVDLQLELKAADGRLSEIGTDSNLTPDERSTVLEEIGARINGWKQSPEWLSLPRQAFAALETKLDTLKQQSDLYAQEFQSVAERVDWLEKWEQLDSAELKKAELEKIWQELPKLGNAEKRSELDERYQNVLCRAIVEVADIAPLQPKLELPDNEALKYFDEHFKAMQQAVEAGLAQEAFTHEEALSRLDLDKLDLSAEQRDQLTESRSEIRRLKGWAKWGGQQSREKLIRFVESLPEQDLSIDELSSAIVNAREQWKSLAAVSGTAARAQWIEFDTLCNRAYEPVLEHAKEQALERQENVLKAEAIIDNARAFINSLDPVFFDADNKDKDWKTIINFYRQISQVWRQIGMVGKAEKKRLDDAFSTALQPVRDALYQQSQLEIEMREQLIEEVRGIDPDSRDSGKLLKAIQQKWQTAAKNFPLDNREDKKLWSRFREVCENLHDRRMEKNKAADSERLEHLQQKEAVCTELESVGMTDAGSMEQRLSQLLKQWANIGNVPRESEAELQKRLDMAVSAIRDKIVQLKAEKMQSALKSLPEKLRLCSEVESRMAAVCQNPDDVSLDMSDDEKYDMAWKTLPPLPDKLENVISHRFYNGLKAMAGLNMGYGKRLADNVLSLKENILRCEIVYGLDSPDELMQERMQMQVKVLQDSLGGDHLQSEEVMKQLLELPALMDDTDIQRISNLIIELKKPG